MLCCVVLRCAVLCCVVLCCVALCCAVRGCGAEQLKGTPAGQTSHTGSSRMGGPASLILPAGTALGPATKGVNRPMRSPC